MNSGKRKAIRDQVKLVIGAIAGADLYTFKKANLINDTPAICVYLEEGDVPHPIERQGVLTIRVMAPDQVDIDDVLDGFGDQVQQLLETAVVDSSIYNYVTEDGYAYERDSADGWTALDIRYQVNY